MKNNYIKFFTGIALFFVLILQGIWLRNTYALLETELQRSISRYFIGSIEKETVERLNDQFKLKKNKKIEGFKVENDIYSNIIAFQNYLYLEEHPLSLEKIDSILNPDLEKELNIKSYTLVVTDSLGNKIAFVNYGKKDASQESDYKEKIQLRTVSS